MHFWFQGITVLVAKVFSIFKWILPRNESDYYQWWLFCFCQDIRSQHVTCGFYHTIQHDLWWIKWQKLWQSHNNKFNVPTYDTRTYTDKTNAYLYLHVILRLVNSTKSIHKNPKSVKLAPTWKKNISQD